MDVWKLRPLGLQVVQLARGDPELGVDRQGSLHTATVCQPPAHSIPAPASPS